MKKIKNTTIRNIQVAIAVKFDAYSAFQLNSIANDVLINAGGVEASKRKVAFSRIPNWVNCKKKKAIIGENRNLNRSPIRIVLLIFLNDKVRPIRNTARYMAVSENICKDLGI